MELNWKVYGKRADFNALGEQFQLDPVVIRVMRNRDLITAEDMERYLYPDCIPDYSPWLFKDMKKAISIVVDKIGKEKKIRIIADYDVDGVCSNYILYKGLLKAGALVDYRIPDRMRDGYGVNVSFIEEAVKDGVDTIITCDNGISAMEPVRLAKKYGLTFIITDHHQLSYEEDAQGNLTYILPEADAVINAQQADCAYPFKSICGAMTVYRFVEALYEKMKIPARQLNEFIEFAALATVCDVMPLVDENRKIVKKGLRKIADTTNKGLRALLKVNELEDKVINAFTFGFVIGPCINATGRLYQADMSVQLFLCEKEAEALCRAARIKEINEERKAMSEEAEKQANAIVEEQNLQEDKIIVLFLPACHESLVGIVAGRLKEKYGRPAIVFTRGRDGMLKGSGRSIDEYHLYKGLKECEDLLLRFGGHPGAAGLSIEEENLDRFREQINANCRLTKEEMQPKLMIDVPMPVSYVYEQLIEELELLEPFGKDNEKPIFAESGLFLRNGKIIGRNQNVLKCMLQDGQGRRVDAVAFQADAHCKNLKNWFGEEEWNKFLEGKENAMQVDVAYYPDINTYMGMKSVQIVIKYIRKHEE